MKSFLLLFLSFAALAAGQVCQMNNGFDITPGTNLADKGTATVGACCDFCKTTSGCVGWVWDKASSGCWLKSSTGPVSPNANLVSGVVIPSALSSGGNCSAVTSGQDYSPGSHDMKTIANIDLATCCNTCSATPGCKAWVWIFSPMNCFLKDVNTPRVANSMVGILSGLPGTGVPVHSLG